MSATRFSTTRELKQHFDKALKGAVELGLIPPSETGLDWETEQVIIAVAKAYPHTSEKLVAKAKAEFVKQLDGTHAREAMGLNV